MEAVSDRTNDSRDHSYASRYEVLRFGPAMISTCALRYPNLEWGKPQEWCEGAGYSDFQQISGDSTACQVRTGHVKIESCAHGPALHVSLGALSSAHERGPTQRLKQRRRDADGCHHHPDNEEVEFKIHRRPPGSVGDSRAGRHT